MDNDIELYKGMKFSNLVEEIVENSRNKRLQLDVLISDLRAFIKGPGDVLIYVPFIKEYIDVGVKNDDQLVKVLAIAQRIMNARPPTDDPSSTGFVLSDEEKKQLQDEIDKAKELDKKIKNNSEKVEVERGESE